MDTVRTWPEYTELLEIVQEKDVDVHHIIEVIRKLYWRGNIFNDLKCKGEFPMFLITCIKCYDAE